MFFLGGSPGYSTERELPGPWEQNSLELLVSHPAVQKDVGVTHLDMPASPQRVWQAIEEAKRRSAAPRLG